MRYPDGSLIGDLGDGYHALVSASLLPTSQSSYDENQTEYELLPVIINDPPTITIPITKGSFPQIRSYNAVNTFGSQSTYLYQDGTVKVLLGSTIQLQIHAEQPDIFNVENGVPTVLQPTEGLSFVWTKDSVPYQTSSVNPFLETATNFVNFVSSSQLLIENIQPQQAGVYTCEISNDIGTTVSEQITIEVYNPDFDAFFFRNLIQNPNASSGTDDWNSTSDDFLSKKFTQIPTADLKNPARTDLFGYNPDTLFPRPYQFDSNFIKNYDYTKNLNKDSSYFTRSRFKFIKNGGVVAVKAYQDIDLTDLQPYIKGGIHGADGIRAIFSCYIGNSISRYDLTDITIAPDLRYKTFNGAPRLSVENFFGSGKGRLHEKVTVTVEEYERETRLSSRIINNSGAITTTKESPRLEDPWSKMIDKYRDRVYYTGNPDYLGIKTSSLGDLSDALLFGADELYPSLEQRYTYGQYVEFNKLVFDRLNTRTTKIRINILFETTDLRPYELHRNLTVESDEIFEYGGYETYQERNSFRYGTEGYWTRRRALLGSDVPRKQLIPLAGDPRGMVTGLNLVLFPVDRYNPQKTNFFTEKMFVNNNRPISQDIEAYDASGWGSYRLGFLKLI